MCPKWEVGKGTSFKKSQSEDKCIVDGVGGGGLEATGALSGQVWTRAVGGVINDAEP